MLFAYLVGSCCGKLIRNMWFCFKTYITLKHIYLVAYYIWIYIIGSALCIKYWLLYCYLPNTWNCSILNFMHMFVCKKWKNRNENSYILACYSDKKVDFISRFLIYCPKFCKENKKKKNFKLVLVVFEWSMFTVKYLRSIFKINVSLIDGKHKLK